MRARAWAWWLALLAGVAGARELDPAACAPRFDVQHDKIIRTEESREMGARYLSELDVGARHECLRLCCETDSCDVFVYEEKGPGSCYLFNCGPPEDFRCKFTAHGNFSSGVLALSRRLAELQDQERLARHEQELADLRGPGPGAASSPAPAAAGAGASTAAAPHAPPAPPPRTTHSLAHDQLGVAAVATVAPGRCSRYQFECRRGGECIAVYNACDGVPQCADGSDEAPELGCPPPRAPAVRPAPPPPPPPPTAPQPPPHKPAQESFETSVGASGEALGAAAAAGERWPHRLAQAQPQHRYNDGVASSHIFSHKGGLLQEPESNALSAQYPPFEPPWPRRGWPPQPLGLSSMEGAPAAGAGVGSAGERGWGRSGGYAREWPEPAARRAWPVPQPPESDQELPAYMSSKTMPEIPVVYSSREQTLRDAPKKGFELIAPRTAASPAPAAAPARPAPARPARLDTTTDSKLVKDKAPEAMKPSGAGAAGGAAGGAEAGAPAPRRHPPPDERDGLGEHPPAAMLLLVLGILMTTAMGAMLGCRARAARRRLRRGKSPFAHDADYLVNGMYL